MGNRDPSLTTWRQAQARRAREMTLVHAVMICLFILVLVQFLLLMAAVEGFQAGHGEILLPAALASGLCFGGSLWLIRHLTRRPFPASSAGSRERNPR